MFIILSKIQMFFIRFEYAHSPMIALLAKSGKIILKIQNRKEMWVIFFFFFLCDNRMKQNN